MQDQYENTVLSINAPVRDAAVITPSDTVAVTRVPRSLFIGVDGDLNVIMAGGTAPILFKAVVGLLPIMVKQVMATGTTATSILALY